MLKRYPFITMVLVHVALACAVGAEPEAKPGGADKPDTREPAKQRPAEIDRIPLIDDDGQLILKPVPLSEYYDMRDRALGVGGESAMDEYQILSLVATGRATKKGRHPSDKGRVDLSVSLKIAVETELKDWIRIPLRFGQAALKTEPSDASVGRYRIDFEASESGASSTAKRGVYVLWLRGSGKGTVEEVSLDFSLPLSGIGRESRLVLSVPTAATTQLTLTVPMPEAIGSVSGAADLETRSNGTTATDFIVRGFRGDIDLSWQRLDKNGAQVAPLLKSDGIIKATVAGRRVEFDATLSVSVFHPPGRELAQFEVRLPPGAVLSQENYPNYTVRDMTTADQKAVEGRLVEVLLRKPVSGQEAVDVTLRATSGAAAARNGQFPLAGFEVPSAILQTGRLDVCARGDWEVRCHPGRGVVQTLEESLGADPEYVASFGYYVQPFALAARTFPKQERIRVEPLYVLSLASEQATLVSYLKYAVRGKEAFQLKLDLNGWEFDRIGPEQDVMAHEVDESGVLVISLQEGTLDEFELKLDVHRPIDPSEPSLVLPMPKPPLTSVSSTELVVLPADNIDLREDREKTVGLERQKSPPPASLELPDIQQEPLYYRGETGEMGEAVFAAAMSVREQEITAELSTEVGITPAKASVKERLVYDVKYVPATELTIRVPEGLAVEYSLDGEVVAVLPTEETSVEGGLVTRRIVLSSPRQGRFELNADYTVPIGDLEPLASVPCEIPLIVPVDVAFTGHRLRATVESGIGIWRGRGSPWQVREDETSFDKATVTEFTTETPEDRIVIGVLQKDPDAFGSAVVHTAWIQTWMTDDQRRDRIVYNFVSDRSHLAITLPSEADMGLLRVLLDGKEVEPDLSNQKVSVALPLEKTPLRHVVELRYICKSRASRGGMLIELPRLAEDVWVRRSYWQLVLPVSEHVVSVPKGYTAEYDWAWTGAWWGRVPVMEQGDLEKWIGAVADEPIPESTSRYLFSKFGPAETADFATASRTWIVSGASGLALLVGLLLIYVPGLRHPLFGLVLVVAIAGSAVAWPGASLLFAQAAGMGLVLSLLAAVLYRGVARRRRRTVRRDVASSVFERGSTQAQFGSSEVELLRSTATEPDAAAVHAPER